MGDLRQRNLKNWLKGTCGIVALIELLGCGKQFQQLPQMNESGTEAGQLINSPPFSNVWPAPGGKSSAKTSSAGVLNVGQVTASGPITPALSTDARIVRLTQSTNLRFKKSGVLEFLVELPPNSEISIPAGSKVDGSNYRISNGQITRNTTGFVTPLKVISIPKGQALSKNIAELNQTPGGLFIAASVVTGLQEIRGNFPPLPLLPSKADYQKYFSADGRPYFTFKKTLALRFGTRLNHLQALSGSSLELKKSRAIMQEMRRVADRQTAAPKSLLMTNPLDAIRLSKSFETTGAVPATGAWSIAVTATAERHGFSNEPCAEFVSEEVREAYTRAGFKIADDFNAARGNELIWSQSAAVYGLERALTKAGWTPWATIDYQPPTGAIVLNGTGESPGHAYLAAGESGRFIVDNGSPQGRDLGQTQAKTIEIMYQGGVFFLPPGISPHPWPSQTMRMAQLQR